jgi:hypothetical protein
LEKCSIITKTYRLCQDVKLNGRQNPNPSLPKPHNW